MALLQSPRKPRIPVRTRPPAGHLGPPFLPSFGHHGSASKPPESLGYQCARAPRPVTLAPIFALLWSSWLCFKAPRKPRIPVRTRPPAGHLGPPFLPSFGHHGSASKPPESLGYQCAR